MEVESKMGSELDYGVVDNVGGYMEYLRNGMSLELKIRDVPLEKEVGGSVPLHSPLIHKLQLSLRSLLLLLTFPTLSPPCEGPMDVVRSKTVDREVKPLYLICNYRSKPLQSLGWGSSRGRAHVVERMLITKFIQRWGCSIRHLSSLYYTT